MRIVIVGIILCLLGPGSTALAAHDKGQKVQIHAATRSGQLVLVSWKDINRPDTVRVAVHDVTQARFVVDRKVPATRLRSILRQLRLKHRLRRPPRARTCHPKKTLCVAQYDWTAANGARSHAVALVGPLGQIVSPAKAVPCFNDEGAPCVAKPGVTTQSALAYWWGAHTVAVVLTWQVKSEQGDTYVPIFFHRKLPKRPQAPKYPPRRT